MTNHSTQPKYLRAEHIATLYPIGESTVWLWAKQGKLTPLRISKGVTVFDADEVAALFSGVKVAL